MAEDQKKAQKDFRAFFEGAPCADMMKKMMECGEGEQTTGKKEQTEEKNL